MVSGNDWIREVEIAAAEWGPTTRDRTADKVAARMMADGVVPDVRVQSSGFRDLGLLVADRFWRMRLLDCPSTATAVECARWIGRYVAPNARTDVELRWGLRFGFITSSECEVDEELAAAADGLSTDDDCEDVAWFGAVVHAGKLRANYRFRALWDFLDSSPLVLAAGRRRREPIMVALEAFAAFGQSKVKDARKLFDHAWREVDAAEAGAEPVVDVCLNGLAVAPGFKGQGQLLVERGIEAIRRFPTSSTIYGHLAVGQALMGGYDSALVSVENALDRLPATGTRNSHPLLREQLIALRRSIIDQRRQAEPPLRLGDWSVVGVWHQNPAAGRAPVRASRCHQRLRVGEAHRRPPTRC